MDIWDSQHPSLPPDTYTLGIDEEEDPSTAKFDGIMLLMALATSLMLAFCIHLVHHVFKLVKYRDLPMLLSVISLGMSLICLLLYCLLSVVRDFQDDDAYLNTSDFLRAVDFLKIMFIFCTLVFDLYKWCIFLVGTNSKEFRDDELEERKQRKRYRNLKIILVSVQTAMLLMSLVLVVLTLRSEPPTEEEWDKALHNFQYNYTVTAFSLFLLTYLAVFVCLTRRLKTYYPRFYMQERRKIFISNISIMVAIVFRITINVILTQQWMLDMIAESTLNNTWFYPLYQLFAITLASLFPIGSILYSLNYGLSNRRKLNMIDMKLRSKMTAGGRPERTSEDRHRSSIGSLLDYAEQIAADLYEEENDDVMSTEGAAIGLSQQYLEKSPGKNDNRVQLIRSKQNNTANFRLQPNSTDKSRTYQKSGTPTHNNSEFSSKYSQSFSLNSQQSDSLAASKNPNSLANLPGFGANTKAR